MEDDDIVNTIEKLRLEMRAQLLRDGFAHLLLIAFRRLYLARAEIRGHNQNGVLEIHRPTLRVR
jgi:hypothetical protein